MSQEQQIKDFHPMRKISISKVVINIGVGKSGVELEKLSETLVYIRANLSGQW
ncbi:MAG: Ribosomal protein [Nitrososphaeraceae archaeon]|nr:Ribosomal protein [Nitrososphaeraceae archaeon]